jgi:drug/metabolite transporter (DMT)-like permease
MQKAIGVACLLVGVLLLAWGHNISQSVGSQVKEAFTGSPTDKAIYFYITGLVLTILGAFRLFASKK